MYALCTNKEIRPDCNIIVSRCSAEDFLKNSKPSLENLSAKYYEIALTSHKYTGYTSDTGIVKFFCDFKDTHIQPVAILGGLNTGKTRKTDGKSNDSYKAGETPFYNDIPRVENMGTAVFNKDKLVGELDGLETICHLALTNNLKSATLTIPSPFDASKSIEVLISLKHKTKSTVDIVNFSPYISSNVKLDAKILSIDAGLDFSNLSNINTLENAIDVYLEEKISEYFYKISKEFNSDIVGFGDQASKNYYTIKEFENYKWLDNFRNSYFNINVKSTINSSGFIIKT